MPTQRPSGRSRTAAKAQPVPEPPDTPLGVNAATVAAYVETLELDERGLALAALALTLASTLDAGAGLALAGVSKELRAVLDALAPVEDDDADPIPGLSAPLEHSSD